MDVETTENTAMVAYGGMALGLGAGVGVDLSPAGGVGVTPSPVASLGFRWTYRWFEWEFGVDSMPFNRYCRGHCDFGGYHALAAALHLGWNDRPLSLGVAGSIDYWLGYYVSMGVFARWAPLELPGGHRLGAVVEARPLVGLSVDAGEYWLALRWEPPTRAERAAWDDR